MSRDCPASPPDSRRAAVRGRKNKGLAMDDTTSHTLQLRNKRSIHDLYHEQLLHRSDPSLEAHGTTAAHSKRHRCLGKALRKARRAAAGGGGRGGGGARQQGSNAARAVQSAPTSPEMEDMDDDSMVDFTCCKVRAAFCSAYTCRCKGH